MSDANISAELRNEFGKGASRRARRAGRIPAVLYGHGQEPVHLTLPVREYSQAIKQGMNTLLTVTVGSKRELALTKAIQRDAIKLSIEHVDLLLVRRGEKVQVEVPVIITGEVAKGGLLNHELSTLSIEAEATHIPESVEVNIDNLEIGAHISAGQVTLPKGSTLLTDPEASVLGVMQAPTQEQMEADTSSTAAVPEPVEEEADTPAE